MAEQVLAVLPSAGLGGGIERYWSWMRGVIDDSGLPVTEVALAGPGQPPTLARKLWFILRIWRAARSLRPSAPVDVVMCHPHLAPIAWLAVRLSGLTVGRTVVLAYGTDIWGLSPVQRRVLARLPVVPVTISSFSAGALSFLGPSGIVPPGISEPWYRLLTAPAPPPGSAPPTDAGPPPGGPRPLDVLTVFRLDDPGKGLPEIVGALEEVRSRLGADVHLTVAGSGALPRALERLVGDRPWITVVRGPSDEELARRYRAADLFVLATRTSFTGGLSGEGFGIVLVEAQLAGTPVVAPAHGGSDDAFLDGVTGCKPAGESAGDLADVLTPLLADPTLLASLGANASAWSRAAFEPRRRNQRVAAVLGWRQGEVGPGLHLAVTPAGDAPAADDAAPATAAGGDPS